MCVCVCLGVCLHLPAINALLPHPYSPNILQPPLPLVDVGGHLSHCYNRSLHCCPVWVVLPRVLQQLLQCVCELCNLGDLKLLTESWRGYLQIFCTGSSRKPSSGIFWRFLNSRQLCRTVEHSHITHITNTHTDMLGKHQETGKLWDNLCSIENPMAGSSSKCVNVKYMHTSL